MINNRPSSNFIYRPSIAMNSCSCSLVSPQGFRGPVDGVQSVIGPTLPQDGSDKQPDGLNSRAVGRSRRPGRCGSREFVAPRHAVHQLPHSNARNLSGGGRVAFPKDTSKLKNSSLNIHPPPPNCTLFARAPLAGGMCGGRWVRVTPVVLSPPRADDDPGL